MKQLLFFTALFAFVLLIAGLFKPWALLWWEDVQNRRKVIRLYGTAALLCFLLYLVIQMSFKG